MRSVISEHGHGAGVGVYIRNCMLQINGPFRTCDILISAAKCKTGKCSQ